MVRLSTVSPCSAPEVTRILGSAKVTREDPWPVGTTTKWVTFEYGGLFLVTWCLGTQLFSTIIDIDWEWEKAKPRADLSVGSGKKITWKTRLFVCVCTTDRLITTMKLLSSLWCDNQPKKVDNSAKIVPKRLTKFPFVKLFHKKKNEEQICGEGESVAQLYYYYIPLLQFFATTLQGLTGQAPTMLGEKISSLP